VKANPHEIGRVVISGQGHDKGRWFVVVGLVDERYVLIADGDTRKMENPKKKQVKHLSAEPETADEAVDAIRAHAQTADSAIRKALKAAQARLAPAGTGRNTDKEECVLVQE
jgi:large subunit ribosomal protein L14e